MPLQAPHTRTQGVVRLSYATAGAPQGHHLQRAHATAVACAPPKDAGCSQVESCHSLQAPHKDTICNALMRLLESAPDSLTHRKEVLVAAKNLLSTPFR